jgi:hypothetical protein
MHMKGLAMISNKMTRTSAALVLAGVWTTLSFGALVAPAPSIAATPAALNATLAEPVKNARIVAGNTLWTCEGTSCVARQSGARPGRLCRDLQRKTGTVVAFTVAGQQLDAEALARCNG